MTEAKKVCLVTGVGPGTGRSIVKKFAEAGYQVAMTARDDTRLKEIVAKQPGTFAYPGDVTDFLSLEETLNQITNDLGPIHTVVHNAVGAVLKNYLDLDPEELRRNFEINTVALLRLAQLVTPSMVERGEGVLLATGNTSAYRGKANFAGFAPTKAAQRILLESIARYAGPMGIHAAYIAIDAVIDVPWTREAFSDKPDEFFCQPDDIAQVCLDVANQPKTAWSSDIVIRPYCENW
ncbi:MAG: SDR family NAD(P)-dependent oxidoreductase [Pseudomonadota bacterium]